ncbi:MAG: cell division protein FtsZ [Candidatus Lambdaproteobacteria bacterium RIFOXYD1_FULL_56_27]|uniref:Cell division protein FtsZ n=1 Tax=Candidatus Lambdaproteobacteria bacterium RIFOXYD2_FULL_56_26 TaxID=1817773 RepID=A0A1F6H3Y6_9PROT|nr:MAG: cell division protein FtsZ [Candidatus Lambdaproteobacteria bacterium RIFOXYC1_FULL_56_13]OGH05046.1 MAG: cell division protein FtsZ [Candidatus Lambdaproteobacteria bacterium RIFOXYD2_FULL_56_26]OGH09511.1 MAG: cell division protein FtsZ [Candidatus Lambdaproteobacteria bacterium RIFOXYD1_FULL_56_27]
MVIEFDNQFEAGSNETGLPVIKVIGVGGGGGNVVNRMVRDGIKKVRFAAANTDVMVLNSSLADVTIPLGTQITKGLGAGMKPDIGKLAAEEAIAQIQEFLKDADMVFIAAGMGGGTGTGAAPVVAEIAREKKILTVGVVTTPFKFEGNKRARIAEKGIEELRKHVDTLMVIPNNKLLEMASQKTTMNEAFEIADDVLKQAISGITNLVNLEGVINLDFADLKTVMSNKGRAIMGTGVGHGENRGLEAAKKAVSSPLLSDKPISGATGVIINIVADEAFSLLDAGAAADFIQGTADQDADVIFGLVSDPTKQDEVVITVIATGFEVPEETVVVQRPVQHAPLRVASSLKHVKEEEEEKPVPNFAAQVPVRESAKEEVEETHLKSVEKDLHYPDLTISEDVPLKVEDYEIPSFMRKQRLQR